MTQNGKDQIQRWNGTEWQTIDSGTAFPDQPNDGDLFQLTKGLAQTTAVDGQTVTLRAPNAGGVISIDRSDYHHNLQWATEGDPLEASIVGNYAVGVR